MTKLEMIEKIRLREAWRAKKHKPEAEMKIQIKSRFTSEILFEHDCENNSIKITLEAAVKARADLAGADLARANLADADLAGADLARANLADAYLARADLAGADLAGAYLADAYLARAYLAGAYLARANLAGAYLDDKEDPIKDIKQVGNIGSRGGFTIAFKCKSSIKISCGCFWGTIDEFEKRVRDTHGDNIHGKQYVAVIEFFRKIWA